MRRLISLCILLLLASGPAFSQDGVGFAGLLPQMNREIESATAGARQAHLFRIDSLGTSTTPTSKGKAFLRSLIIPGWGQKSIGAKTSARTFFAVEVALWAGFTMFQLRGHWLEENYRLFGKTHAGFDENGKADRYFVDVGNYNSIDEYNEAKLRNRDLAGLYDREAFFWKWDSETNRGYYDHIRVRSERAFSNSSFVIAGVLANHVISGIHAAYLTGRRQKDETQGAVPAPAFFVESSMRDIRLVARVQF